MNYLMILNQDLNLKMRLINSSFEIIPQEGYRLKAIEQQIEKCARVCYKSEDRVTDTSYKAFVERLTNSGHLATLEHGTVYMVIPNTLDRYIEVYIDNPYTKVKYSNGKYYVTTNYRMLHENERIEDLKYLCEPTEHHAKRVTVKFILPISISREFLRHRVFSFCEQSTRYCNFSKDKFGNELTFIKPYWYDMEHPNGSFAEGFDTECKRTEELYIHLTTECGLKAQEAREFLPLCIKTELVMTGFIEDWLHFFELRCDSKAHPQARELAIPLKEEFIKKGYLNG